MRTAILFVLLTTQGIAAESLQSVPVNYTEVYLRAIFCDATFAATVSEEDFAAAVRWAGRYDVTCENLGEYKGKPVTVPVGK